MQRLTNFSGKSIKICFVAPKAEKTKTIEGVRIIKSLNFKENSLVGAFKVWKAMHAAGAQIYFQETSSWGTFLVALFCKIYKKIFIYRSAHQNNWNGTFAKRHFLAGKAFYWALHSAALVAVQNEIDRVKFKENMGVSSIVIPYALRSFTLFEVQKDIILWVARSASFKRPQLFIDLAEKFPAEHFIMICPHATGDDGYDMLLDRARKVANLRFIERVPFHEIISYFRRAKLFVNTSIAEGFPVTFIQAATCGVPILSLKVNPDGFLDRYNCGVCCNDNWEELVNSLKRILEGERCLELGRNARKYVEEHHDITKIIEQYKTIFIHLTKQKDATSSSKV